MYKAFKNWYATNKVTDNFVRRVIDARNRNQKDLFGLVVKNNIVVIEIIFFRESMSPDLVIVDIVVLLDAMDQS